MAILKYLTALALAGSLASCSPQPRTTDTAAQFLSNLIANVTQAGQTCTQDNSLVVDLGYAKYRGYHEATSGLNLWKGVRYAAPPLGNLRWQPPHPLPAQPGAPITDAAAFGPTCAQSLPAVPNAPFFPGSEDCLYLNVFAPANVTGKLPVMVWIHPGGYGYGDGTQDMTEIIKANEKGFVAVTIQYRLGAFGWLSSSEVKQKGAVNAGMLDQALALAWVKLHICQFGGDPSAVTIAGESAGGSSVMYHGLAANGNLGTLLFKQGIASSPYLPFQYKYDDAFPTSKYYAFSVAAGCPSSGDVLACLVGKDTDTLQQASFVVNQASTYGYWGFWPVTDNVYITQRASQQLLNKRVNGKKLLVGHNANEGGLFVPPAITTEADVTAWLSTSQFPNLTPAQINAILAANPNSALTSPSGPHFETNGLSTSATAVTVSQDANGQQQRANNIYAEATFACPAYWMASAYTNSNTDTQAWLYQYSVPFAFHGSDIAAFFGPQAPNHSDDFVLAVRRMWGNFVRTGNPSITAAVANGGGDTTTPHPATNWPVFAESGPKLMNLNITGGVPYEFVNQWGSTVKQFMEPGLQNAITLANADAWEGGRRARCNVYRDLGASIPV